MNVPIQLDDGDVVLELGRLVVLWVDDHLDWLEVLHSDDVNMSSLPRIRVTWGRGAHHPSWSQSCSPSLSGLRSYSPALTRELRGECEWSGVR